MDPMSMYLLFGSVGSKIFGDLLGANSEEKKLQAQMQQQEEGRQDSKQKQIADFLTSMMSQKQNQANVGLGSTQMDPYAQAGYLNKRNIQRSFAQGYNPSTGFSGSFDTSALSPESLQKSGDNFYTNVAAAAPNTPINMSKPAEDFRTSPGGPQASGVADQSKVMNFLQGSGAGPNDPYASVRNIYSEVTGGSYEPTQRELTGWGTDLDENYLNKIRGAVANWWQQKNGGGR